MKKLTITILAICVFLSGCNSSNNDLMPEKLSDNNWKNGVWILKDGRNGFFITADPALVKVSVGEKLMFAKSGDRIVTEVVVSPPYINIYVDRPLDPEGDGFPNKVGK